MIESTFVFAYGSNMDPAQMRERCPQSDLSYFIAEARGWKLCFPRESKKRKGGVGSISRDDAESVWGVVFAVSLTDLIRLDRFEGVPNSYERNPVEVFDREEVRHSVLTYFARPQDTPPREYLPHKNYVALYVRGAEYFALPAAYLGKLRALRTKSTKD